MQGVVIMFFLSLSITPCTHSFEGTLLGLWFLCRLEESLNSLSLSFSGCFSMGALLLQVVSRKGYGLAGCWGTLVAFQYGRFFLHFLVFSLPVAYLSLKESSKGSSKLLSFRFTSNMLFT